LLIPSSKHTTNNAAIRERERERDREKVGRVSKRKTIIQDSCYSMDLTELQRLYDLNHQDIKLRWEMFLTR
jgi:hypothetical protein